MATHCAVEPAAGCRNTSRKVELVTRVRSTMNRVGGPRAMVKVFVWPSAMEMLGGPAPTIGASGAGAAREHDAVRRRPKRAREARRHMGAAAREKAQIRANKWLHST